MAILRPMSGKENNEYVLGTDQAELHRLGLQHQVWASETHKGWETANFSAGQTILDLGCGPGFCSKELAYVVGESGKVIAVDKSKNYIDFLEQTTKLYGLNIASVHTDFNDLNLEANSIDAMYCRWALAWIENPKEILVKVYDALKIKGKMVIHEYFDWSTHQTQPKMPALSKAIEACMTSFSDQPGNIDVGRHILKILSDLGMKIQTRPMAKLASPKDFTWQWPKSFYQVYFKKLIQTNYLSQDTANKALSELAELENMPDAHLFCPTLIEVIAEKV